MDMTANCSRQAILKQKLEWKLKGSERDAIYAELRELQKQDPLNF